MGQDRTALSFNVGTEWDLTLTINGQVLGDFGLHDSYDRKVNATLIEIKPWNNNGRMVRRTTYEGFTFTYAITRQDDSLDDLVDALMKNYHAHGPEPSFAGLETVINQGTASQWQYTGGTVVPDGLGNVVGADKTGSLSITIHWANRNKIRGGSVAPTLAGAAGL